MCEQYKSKVLFVDDNADVLDSLLDLFSRDYDALTATNGKECIGVMRSQRNVAVIVMDIRMSEMDGLEASKAVRAMSPETILILHSAYAGDYDEDEISRVHDPFAVIDKGSSISRLRAAIKEGVEKYRFRTNPGFLTDQALSGMGLVGQSRPMQQVFRQILDVAKTSAPVLLTGETGTGKTLTAMAIHKSSKRHNKKFVFLDCTKKSTDLVLSELFGHDKGVFTDAKEIRKGLFEDAEGGTVLLDEIGDLDEDKQIGLLKVIDSGQYKRAGEHEIRQIDCRLIYATNRDLKDLVESGNMRNDFYYRLDHSVRVHLPPLREHKEDIPLLADHFLQVATIKHELTPRILTDDAMQMLRDFDWPGNIRQVANVIERAAITTSTGFIHGEDIALHCEDKSSHRDFILLDGSVSLPEVLKKHERDYICQALAITKGNISAAADLLKIDRTNLQKKKETHGIDVSVFKGGDGSDSPG